MLVQKNELRVSIDVDGTLIKDDPSGSVTLDFYGIQRRVTPLKRHIELLVSYKKRGYYVKVHSANGVTWAEEVVNKFGLSEFVDEVATKDIKYVDDVEAALWCQRVFINE